MSDRIGGSAKVVSRQLQAIGAANVSEVHLVTAA